MKIAPSILTANFNNLAAEIKSIESADLIHVDIMDGNFVPNISFGPHITKEISNISNLDLDIHLMVLDPSIWIDKFSFHNTKYITVHVESNNFEKALKLIRKNNIKTGISLRPKTDLDKIKPYLKDLDLVLIMTVEPGFGGQSFMIDQLEKVKELVDLRQKNNYNYLIEVDGGINNETIELCREAGVDIAVAGSYIFNLEDRKKGILSLK